MKKNLKLIAVLLLIVFVSWIWKALWDYEKYHDRTKPTLTLKQFNKMNNTHILLTKIIKSETKDSASVNVLATTYSDNGDHLVVTETYQYMDTNAQQQYDSRTGEFTYEGVLIRTE